MRNKRLGSVQASFLPLREVRGSLLYLTSPGQPQARLYRAILDITGINFALLSDDERQQLFERYQKLINSLSFPTQVVVRICPMDLNAYLRYIEGDIAVTSNQDAVDRLSASHAGWLREMTGGGEGLLERRFYIVVAADDFQSKHVPLSRFRKKEYRRQEALTFAQAEQQLRLRIGVIQDALQEIGLHVRELEDSELIHLYDECLGGTRRGRAFPLTREIVDATRSPQYLKLEDVLSPTSLRVEPRYLSIDEQEFVCALAVRGIPRVVQPGWMQKVIMADETMDIIMHQFPRKEADALHILRRKQTQYQSAVLYSQSKGKNTHPFMTMAAHDISPLLERVAAGEDRLHDHSIHILVRAGSEAALEERVQRVSEIVYAVCHHRPQALLYEQERGFKLALPGNLLTSDSMLLDSTSVATAFPFFSNLVYRPSETSILEGVTPQNEPVVLDIWELPNYNSIIFAPSGSGKSYKKKVDVARIYTTYARRARRLGLAGQTFQIICIDPEREFKRECEFFGGQLVQLAPGARSRINPFDLPRPGETQRAEVTLEKEDVLASQIQRIHYLLDAMLAHHSPENPQAQLTVEEKAVLDIALYETYRRAGVSSDPATHGKPAPLLRDLYHVLESGEAGPDPTNLAGRLRRYVHGSLAALFSEPTNVELGNNLVVFDLKGLDGELRTIVLMLISSLTWNLAFGSTIPRFFIIDELATLARFPSGLKFAEEMYEKARKMYLGIHGITQHPGMFQNTSIISNCSVQILMRQDNSTRSLIEQMFSLSQPESRMVRGLKRGEALMLVDGKRMPVRFLASPLEHRLATTNPVELAELERAEGQRI